ncbi:MAG: ribosomal RNA small subunit methyltransferase A [Clostridia bacterium]|nr:ribosomal RNA small subunit methyltransferase A [Clostridia bacterium]
MDIKNILRKNNFNFEKKYGQNFLTDFDLLSRVVDKSGVDSNSTVIEIGVGAGTLTSEIAKKVKKVYGYEIDTKLKPILKETLGNYNNIELVFNDIMKIPMEEIEEKLGGKYTLIANLPYYITTPIIMRFIEDAKNCEAIIVTIQKEVALRICAEPKTSDYGAITASINAVGNSEIIEFIGREKFLPPPNVDSAVVKITLDKNKYEIKDINAYKKLIKCAFGMRRKTLVNNLIKDYKISREDAENKLLSLNIPITARGEELSAIDFIKLSEILNYENS